MRENGWEGGASTSRSKVRLRYFRLARTDLADPSLWRLGLSPASESPPIPLPRPWPPNPFARPSVPPSIPLPCKNPLWTSHPPGIALGVRYAVTRLPVRLARPQPPDCPPPTSHTPGIALGILNAVTRPPPHFARPPLSQSPPTLPGSPLASKTPAPSPRPSSASPRPSSPQFPPTLPGSPSASKTPVLSPRPSSAMPPDALAPLQPLTPLGIAFIVPLAAGLKPRRRRRRHTTTRDDRDNEERGNMAWQVVLPPASLKVRAFWLFVAFANPADPSLRTRSYDQPHDHDDDSPLRLSLAAPSLPSSVSPLVLAHLRPLVSSTRETPGLGSVPRPNVSSARFPSVPSCSIPFLVPVLDSHPHPHLNLVLSQHYSSPSSHISAPLPWTTWPLPLIPTSNDPPPPRPTASPVPATS